MKLFLKVLQYPQGTPVLKSIFKKVADLQNSNFIKKTQHRCLPVNIAKHFNATYFEKHLTTAAF